MAAIDNLEKVKITVDGTTVECVGGSFKGVPFFVNEHDREGGGRNIVTKLVPFSSNFIHEDTGGKVPVYRMQIFFVGAECYQARNNFIAACDEEGAGELIHPFYGKFRADCTGLTIRGDRSGVNYCTAEVVFEPKSSDEGAAVRKDLAGVTRANARDFQNQSVSKFATVFSVVGKGKMLLDKAVESTEKAMDSVLSARTVLATANDFVDAIGKIKANAEVIMMAPEDFATRCQNILTATASMFGVGSEDDDSLDEYLRMIDSLEMNESPDSPAGQIQALMVNIAASQLVISLVDAKFDNTEEASEFQDRVSASFERLLSVTTSIDDYMALSNLEATALSFLRDSIENIAVVLEKKTTSSQNILSLCFDVYGDLNHVEDIMNRNGFAQGLFIQPGKVKVVSE